MIRSCPFRRFAAEHHWSFEYNGRNELDKAERFAGDDPDDPDDQYTSNGDFIFAYDNIGNRATYRLDDEENPTAYTRNPLNQYTDTSYPTESFSYDRDGNMTADGTYAYTWDGENRLIGVAPASSPVNGDKKLEFKYDYMGRRVEKIYSLHNGSTWVEQTHERFVYDEWNVIMVLNGNSDPVNQTLRKYTWGLDMSELAGSGVAPGVSPVVSGIHGAGGIGGLLAGEEMSGTHQGSYWYFYDGNGNVGQILKYEADSPPTISTAARYEYDPYGNVIGPDPDNDGDWQEHATEYAKANPIRFSTKWFDKSGLGYWGYRYYSPRLGRWMSRDPIEEEGGISNYFYVLNSPLCNIDFLGLQQQNCCPRDAGQCCRDAKTNGLNGNDLGGVICCDGKKVACVWQNHSADPSQKIAEDIIIDCVTKHELDHFDDVPACPNQCPDMSRPPFKKGANRNKEECSAHKKELSCYKKKRNNCAKAPNPQDCRKRIDDEIKVVEGEIRKYCVK